MFWVRISSDLAEHPKAARLAELLGIDPMAAVGHLVSFFGWVGRQASDGNLEGIPDVSMAYGAHWHKSPPKFVKALQGAGFLDGRKVHGWEQMNGRALREAGRKREARMKARAKLGSTDMSRDKGAGASADASPPASTPNDNDDDNGVLSTPSESGKTRSGKKPNRSAKLRACLAPALRSKGFSGDQVKRALGMLKGLCGDPVKVLAAMLASITAHDAPAYAATILRDGGPTDEQMAEAKRLMEQPVEPEGEDMLSGIGGGRWTR